MLFYGINLSKATLAGAIMSYIFLIFCLVLSIGCSTVQFQPIILFEKELTEHPPIIEAIRQIESGGHGPKAVSSKGARGSMQIMPNTARALGYHPDEMFDHDKAMEAGSKYYYQLLNETCKGNVHCALRSYFCGPGKRNMKVCYRYADKVLAVSKQQGYNLQIVSKPKRASKSSPKRTATTSVTKSDILSVSPPSFNTKRRYSFAIDEISSKRKKNGKK